MELKIHLCHKVNESLFDNFEHEFNEVFNSNFKVSLDNKFSTDAKNPKDISSCAEEEDIFQYDGLSFFGEQFVNLTKVTRNYQKDGSVRAFYLTKSFYHYSIKPIPTVNIGAFTDDKAQQNYRMNGTVDFTRNHLLIGGTNFFTDENYSVIFHELFHLFYDQKLKSSYDNSEQIAHCGKYIGQERCIMNPPKNVLYSPECDHEKLGLRFCQTCMQRMTELNIF